MKRKILLLTAVLLPAVICLVYICNYGVSVPIMDEWEMVAFSQHMENGGLHFSDLFAQHNEHRILFARLAYLSITACTDYNTVALMLFSFLMLSIGVSVIMSYISRRQVVSFNKRYVFAALIAFLVYSFAQYENLLWGFQIGFIMVLVLSVLSFYFLYLSFEAKGPKRQWLFFAIALLFAIVDSFAHSQGLMTWITASLLMLLLYRKKVLKLPIFWCWNIVAVMTWAAYFHHYVKPEHHPSLSFVFQEPGTFIHYFLSILGNALAGGLQSLTVISGIFILAALGIAVYFLGKSKQLQSYFFPLALAVNSLFILGSISLGRAGFGVEQSLASRYTSFSLYAVVAVCLLWMELKDTRAKGTIIKNMTVIVVVLLALTIPLNLYNGIQQGSGMKKDREYSAYILKTIDQQPDMLLQRLYPWPEKIKERAPYLQQHHLNVFHSSQYEIPSLLLNDSLAQKNNDLLTFAQNPVQIAPDFLVILRPIVKAQYKDKVTALYADIDGQLFALYGIPALHNKPVNPGEVYDLSAITFHVLTKGVHTLRFKALTTADHYYLVDLDWKFEVK